MQDIKVYRKKFDQFRGADFSADPTRVADFRSPFCQNLISDLAGFPEKRPGWRTLHKIPQPVNGLFYCVFKSGTGLFIEHGGTKLYSWSADSEPAEIYSAMNNSRSAAFAHDNKLYILDEAQYLCVYETESGLTVSRVADSAFIPTTVIGSPGAGGGTPFEAVNLLTGRRKNSMVGDGTNTVFSLDTKPISEVHYVRIDGIEKTAGADYTADLLNGTVTFLAAPPDSAAGGGIDNVLIEFTAPLPDGYTDRIEKCSCFAFFGPGNDSRVFLGGNPLTPNADYQKLLPSFC
jgi:hypothetical protein